MYRLHINSPKKSYFFADSYKRKFDYMHMRQIISGSFNLEKSNILFKKLPTILIGVHL